MDSLKTTRYSNIELLRIVAMFLIVLHHFTLFSVIFLFKIPDMNTLQFVNASLSGFLSAFGKVGVDIFVLICGYFMIDSKFKPMHIFKIYSHVIVYTLFFLILSFFIGTPEHNSTSIKSSLFPIGYSMYWFVTSYLVLYFFSPYINLLFKFLSRKNILFLLVVTSLAWVIAPTFSDMYYDFCTPGFFIYLYVMGACIKKKMFFFLENGLFIKSGFVLSLLFFFFCEPFRIISHTDDLFRLMKFTGSINYLPTVFISLFIFNFFRTANIRQNKTINYIASSAFSVYLITSNYFVHSYLWKKIFYPLNNLNSPYFVLWAIFASIIIYILSTVFDKFFKLIFGKFINFVQYKSCDILTKIYSKVQIYLLK